MWLSVCSTRRMALFTTIPAIMLKNPAWQLRPFDLWAQMRAELPVLHGVAFLEGKAHGEPADLSTQGGGQYGSTVPTTSMAVATDCSTTVPTATGVGLRLG